jgi:hypothetical protein
VSTATTAENLHHLWDTPGFPHRGWECLEVIDLNPDEEPADQVDYETCEACGRHPIRFVHVLEHDGWDDRVEVGCICSARLTEDYVTPIRRERELKNEAARRRRAAGKARERLAAREACRALARATWDGMRWQTSEKGNPWLKVDGLAVVVFPAGEGYRCLVGDVFGVRTYGTVEEAKRACLKGFEYVHEKGD